MPPVRSGIATCSAQLIPALRVRHEIDVFVDDAVPRSPETLSAHDFLWRHRHLPYDLTVYQVGNSSHHDYLWPYLFRFPGLTVLHDAHLHHARASALLRSGRTADYRAEFVANHPDASAGAAELAIAGFDSHLYYMWPMVRIAVEHSRLTAVHSRQIANALKEEFGTADVEHIRLSQGTPIEESRALAARQGVRTRYAIEPEAIAFGCFGGLTPDKRIGQILDAFAAILPYAPGARLLLAGAAPAHYDIAAEVRHRELGREVVIAGYLDTDDELTDCIAAVDVTLNLRWPTARETSGPWLRSLAAGKPAVIIDLLQTADVPALDPRTWLRSRSDREPVTVAIDIMDEDHSLRLALRRLAQDAPLRHTLGEAARRYWLEEHSPEAMLDDYERMMDAARSKPAPPRSLPPHLVNDGTGRLAALIAPFGLPSPLPQTR